jgi:hypothetical protein
MEKMRSSTSTGAGASAHGAVDGGCQGVCPITKTCSRTETHPHAARPKCRSAPAHRRFRLGSGSDCACSRPICARTAYTSCQNAAPQGQDRPTKRQELPIDFPAPLCQYRAMLGETRKPILPHPRSARYLRAREKQIPIRYCFLREWRRPVSWMPERVIG